MITNGYVKFSREIMTRSWFDDTTTLKVYVFLLCGAAFKDIEREGYTIHKGQYVTSLKKLAEDCQQTFQQTRTALKHLQATHDITINTTSKFSIITVNSMVDDNEANTLVNNLANTLTNTQTNNRSISKEENKEKITEEVREDVLPARFESSFFDFSKSSSDPVNEREALVKEYGSSAVSTYEKKFVAWAANKRPNIQMYPTIAKWMAQDIKVASAAPIRSRNRAMENSSIDVEEFERAIMKQYERGSVQKSQNISKNNE